MRVVRPKNQREANTLKSRLIPEALSEADRKRAEHELRIANPHLNLDRLDADSVVVVPSTVAVPEGVTVDEEAVERLRRASPEALRERIVPLRAHLEASIARDAEEREVLRRDFRARGVKAATDADPELAAQVERIREQLTEDARDARERAARLESLVAQATTDLGALQERFG